MSVERARSANEQIRTAEKALNDILDSLMDKITGPFAVTDEEKEAKDAITSIQSFLNHLMTTINEKRDITPDEAQNYFNNINKEIKFLNEKLPLINTLNRYKIFSSNLLADMNRLNQFDLNHIIKLINDRQLLRNTGYIVTTYYTNNKNNIKEQMENLEKLKLEENAVMRISQALSQLEIKLNNQICLAQSEHNQIEMLKSKGEKIEFVIDIQNENQLIESIGQKLTLNKPEINTLKQKLDEYKQFIDALAKHINAAIIKSKNLNQKICSSISILKGYDVVAIPKYRNEETQTRLPGIIYLEDTLYGLHYELLGLDGELKADTIHLPDKFPKDPNVLINSYEKKLKEEFLIFLRQRVQTEGYTLKKEDDENENMAAQMELANQLQQGNIDLTTIKKYISDSIIAMNKAKENLEKEIDIINDSLSKLDSNFLQLKNQITALQSQFEIINSVYHFNILQEQSHEYQNSLLLFSRLSAPGNKVLAQTKINYKGKEILIIDAVYNMIIEKKQTDYLLKLTHELQKTRQEIIDPYNAKLKNEFISLLMDEYAHIQIKKKILPSKKLKLISNMILQLQNSLEPVCQTLAQWQADPKSDYNELMNRNSFVRDIAAKHIDTFLVKNHLTERKVKKKLFHFLSRNRNN